MSNVPDKATFANAYADKAPWDIGRPQRTFVEAADQVTGSILDAGCGTGENALFFAKRGHQVTGIDFLEEPIKRARQKGAERGLQANFLVMDALALADLPQTFDTVIDCGLFHVFNDTDRQQYVRGLTEVIKPGGKLLVDVLQRRRASRRRSSPGFPGGTADHVRQRLVDRVDRSGSL